MQMHLLYGYLKYFRSQFLLERKTAHSRVFTSDWQPQSPEERVLKVVHGHAGFNGLLRKHCYRSWLLVKQLSKNLFPMLSDVSTLSTLMKRD